MHIVFGAYDGPIDAKPGEKVVFIGDCASWQGKINDKLVRIESLYKDRSTKDPHHAKHDDIYAKMMSVVGNLRKAKNQPHVVLGGCPVSVAEQVLALVSLGKTKNPYFAADQVVGFNGAYLSWRAVRAFKRLSGEAYQKKGPCARGQAAPEIVPPADPAE
jgi:hypothetical protein